MGESDTILISGLEFYGYHGASDQEQTVGHRYLVDARLQVDTRPAGASDRLNDTVSYSRVAKRIDEIGTEKQFRLLEALAALMAQTVFEEFPLVEGTHPARSEDFAADEQHRGLCGRGDHPPPARLTLNRHFSCA